MERSHCRPIDRWPKVIASVASFPEELVEIVFSFSAGLALVILVRDCVYGSRYAPCHCESVHVLLISVESVISPRQEMTDNVVRASSVLLGVTRVDTRDHNEPRHVPEACTGPL